MEILKIVDSTVSMESLNHSLKDLPCYGISIQSKYGKDGNLMIKDTESQKFIEELLPTNLKINLHLFNERKLAEEDHNKIARELERLSKLATIILSSSHLSRTTLNKFRDIILTVQQCSLSESLPKIYIAANDDLTRKEKQKGDMIYSNRPKSRLDYEFDRLVDYVKNGVPVLLDWYDNYDQRISKMIERTNNSDKLLVLSHKPQTTRRIENNCLSRMK